MNPMAAGQTPGRVGRVHNLQFLMPYRHPFVCASCSAIPDGLRPSQTFSTRTRTTCSSMSVSRAAGPVMAAAGARATSSASVWDAI